MDFFEHQDAAKRYTSILIFYYFLSVAATITGVYFALVITIKASSSGEWTAGMVEELSLNYQPWWDPKLFFAVTSVTLLIVALGSLYKIMTLSKGGQAVAELLGGRIIPSSTTDPNERRLLNVVEEMAIASGVPVPPVYVLREEENINAFAAGFTPESAVIAVTRGCLERLSRDELQGVIAHEFSHILNGDMGLNIKLMGVLHGILVIALIGYMVVRTMPRTRSTGGGKKGNGAGLVLLFGFLLMIIGYVGVFFAKLIKSAVSRQREYLADASAVQFTRNPAGIAEALKKIGATYGGSRLETAHAEEASHMFFSNGLRTTLFSMMSTHPPLEERIRRIDPSFSGVIENFAEHSAKSILEAEPMASGFTDWPKVESGGPGARIEADAEKIIQSVGAPKVEHLDAARTLIAGLPNNLRQKTQESFGARAVVYALLLSADEKVRELQLAHLKTNADPLTVKECISAYNALVQLSAENRLPLLDLAVPALKMLSKGQYQRFRDDVWFLIKADSEVSIFEFALAIVLLRSVESAFLPPKVPSGRYKDAASVMPCCQVVLSALSHFGAENEAEAEASFNAGRRELGFPDDLKILEQGKCSMTSLNQALVELFEAAMSIKKLFLQACVKTIIRDNTVTVEEAELLRAVSEGLGCPMPVMR